MRPVVPLAALLALVASGCVAPGTAPLEAASTTEADALAWAPLGLAGAACWEGGGHSVHPRWADYLPAPWVPADVIGDVGPQFLYSEVPDPAKPIPEEGSTMGNWHATVWCEGWTLDGEARDDMLFGYVGMKVEPPPFDDASEPATHHYLVTVIATNDDEVHARLTAAGFAAMKATAEKTATPDGTLRVQMWTDANGAYDTVFRPKDAGAMEATRIRLWFQSTPEGHGAHHDDAGEGEGPWPKGEFRPIAIDLVSTGGTHLAGEGQGYFSHSGTDHHAPLPGAYGHTAAFGNAGFDRTFEWGPRPDVVLDAAYVH